MSVTEPIAVHLKDLCHWEGSIIEPMIDLQHGAEFYKLVVEEISAGVSHIASPDILLRSTEIAYEVIPEGGRHCVHKPTD